MIEGTAKASRSIHTPRSQASLDMGSLYTFQALLRRFNQSVHVSYERMDSVQAGGMLRRVALEAIAKHMRRHDTRNTGRVDGRVEKRPFPPPPHRSDTGVIHNFSPSSPQFCTLTNSKD
jgi:hypothetical protein